MKMSFRMKMNEERKTLRMLCKNNISLLVCFYLDAVRSGYGEGLFHFVAVGPLVLQGDCHRLYTHWRPVCSSDEIVIYLSIMMWLWFTWCNIEIKQKKQVLIILRVVMHDIKQCLQLIKKWKSYINELIVHFIAFNDHMNKQNIFNVPIHSSHACYSSQLWSIIVISFLR